MNTKYLRKTRIPTLCIGLSLAAIHTAQAEVWNGTATNLALPAPPTERFEEPLAWTTNGAVPGSSSSQTLQLNDDGVICTIDATTWTYLSNNNLLQKATEYRGANRFLFGQTQNNTLQTIVYNQDIGNANILRATNGTSHVLGARQFTTTTVNIFSGTLILEADTTIAANASSCTATVNISDGGFIVGREDLRVGGKPTSVGLFSMTGGFLRTRTGLQVRAASTFEVQGSAPTEIGIGSQSSGDGFATIDGTIKVMVDGGGLTPIFIDDEDGGGAGAVVFNSGSLLDASFLSGTPDTVGTWTVLEVEGSTITDNGLAFAPGVDTDPLKWTFNVDNSGVNGKLTVSWGLDPLPPLGPEIFWDGTNVAPGGDWDTTNENWYDDDLVASALYVENSPVKFDSFAENKTVNLTASFSPNSISVIEAANYTFTGPGSLSGLTGITMDGTGNLALNNTGGSDFTGTVTLNSGTITLGDATALGDSIGDVVITGGELDLGGLSVSKGTVSLTNGTISNGTLTSSTVSAAAGTIDAVLAGASATLSKTGAGTLTLNGANTYDGETTLNGGTVILGSASALGSATGPTRLEGVIATGVILDLNGQTITETISQTVGTIINSDLTTTAQIPDINDNISNVFFGGPGDIITGNVSKTGTNTRRITKDGSGTITFAGTINNNRMGLTVNEGNVNLQQTGGNVLGRFNLVLNNVASTVTHLASDQIHDNTDINGRMAINAGTLDLNGFNEGFGALSTSSGTEVDGVVTNSDVGTTSTLTLLGSFYDPDGGGEEGPLPSADQPAAFPGTVSGNLNLVKNGGFAQTLSGANTYTGFTQISGGTIVVGNASALGTSIIGGANGSFTGTLDVNGFAITNAIDDKVLADGTIANNGAAVDLSDMGTFGATATRSFNVDGTGDITFGQAITGSYSIVKNGANTLTLSGANTYVGSTTVNAGTLALNGTSLSDNPGSNLVLNGGTVTVGGTGTETVDTLFLGAVQQEAGTYTNTEIPAITSGSITVVTSPANAPFETWAAAKGLNEGVNDGPTDDPDGDGENLYEYFFWDSDPTTAEVFGSEISNLVLSAGDVVFTHDQPQDLSDVVVTYQWTTDLGAGWTDGGASDGTSTFTFTTGTTGAPANGNGTDYESVEVTGAVTAGATPAQAFVRVSVTPAP